MPWGFVLGPIKSVDDIQMGTLRNPKTEAEFRSIPMGYTMDQGKAVKCTVVKAKVLDGRPWEGSVA